MTGYKTSLSTTHGFTLIEIIIALVVLSVGIAGFTLAFRVATIDSVDPFFQQQANAIAQSYLEEAMLKPFCDPNNFSAADCPVSCNTNACGGTCSATGEARANYDSVCDYDQVTGQSPPVDLTGAPLASLTGYTVNINVLDRGIQLGPAGNLLDSNSGEVVQIEVEVSHTSGASSSLTAYRANY